MCHNLQNEKYIKEMTIDTPCFVFIYFAFSKYEALDKLGFVNR